LNREKSKNERARVLTGTRLLAPLCAQSVHIESCSHYSGYFRRITIHGLRLCSMLLRIHIVLCFVFKI